MFILLTIYIRINFDFVNKCHFNPQTRISTPRLEYFGAYYLQLMEKSLTSLQSGIEGTGNKGWR